MVFKIKILFLLDLKVRINPEGIGKILDVSLPLSGVVMETHMLMGCSCYCHHPIRDVATRMIT